MWSFLLCTKQIKESQHTVIVVKMSVYLFTENMLDYPEVKKNVSHTPEKELEEFLKLTLQSKQELDGLKAEHYVHLIPKAIKINEEERSTLKISAKLFMNVPNEMKIYKAFNEALQSLGFEKFDAAVVAWPHPKEQLFEVWPVAENLVDDGLVSCLGVSDVETQTFVLLHEKSRLKPEIVQINLEACCVVPPELASFARANDIQLLTHNDPKELLPKKTIEEIAKSTGCNWLKEFSLDWAVRYQALVKCRGVLKAKGYVIKLVKD
ncbi:glutamate--cysteine ligase regulatory subunit-like isoform X2 [Artemia franciscana]|uniref:glutamate--cysteine ligase regulatory subunit-like isoform X2 n=1 Tax=Artemia franciscana TaxID=6661 RepID=UPI0032DBAC1F